MGAATDRTYAPGRNVTVPFGAGSPGTAYTPSALEKAAIPTSGVHRQPTLLASGAAGDFSCTVDAQRVPAVAAWPRNPCAPLSSILRSRMRCHLGRGTGRGRQNRSNNRSIGLINDNQKLFSVMQIEIALEKFE